MSPDEGLSMASNACCSPSRFIRQSDVQNSDQSFKIFFSWYPT
jgi:hypothetical protein